MFAPELSVARIYWAKNSVLATVVDDFFDVGSSEEDQVNLIQLVEKYFLFPILIFTFTKKCIFFVISLVTDTYSNKHT